MQTVSEIRGVRMPEKTRLEGGGMGSPAGTDAQTLSEEKARRAGGEAVSYCQDCANKATEIAALKEALREAYPLAVAGALCRGHETDETVIAKLESALSGRGDGSPLAILKDVPVCVWNEETNGPCPSCGPGAHLPSASLPGKGESPTKVFQACSECGGDGGDLEDSSKDCFVCGGSGKQPSPPTGGKETL